MGAQKSSQIFSTHGLHMNQIKKSANTFKQKSFQERPIRVVHFPKCVEYLLFSELQTPPWELYIILSHPLADLKKTISCKRMSGRGTEYNMLIVMFWSYFWSLQKSPALSKGMHCMLCKP